ncbi:hypothetical protein ACSSS7_004294 [Eimeria intestinalis]
MLNSHTSWRRSKASNKAHAFIQSCRRSCLGVFVSVCVRRGRGTSEVAVGRACGTVEAFATSWSEGFENAASGQRGCAASRLDVPLRFFQLPSTPVALASVGSQAARAYTRATLCKAWLGEDVTAGAAQLRELLQVPVSAQEEALSEQAAYSSNALLAVGNKGHACVVDWEGSFAVRLVEQPDGTEDEKDCLSDGHAEGEPVEVPIVFKPIRSEAAQGSEPEQARLMARGAFRCRAAYLLPGPVAAASSHPLCRSLLAVGGRHNDAKVVDLEQGKTLWAAKNVKPSFLGLAPEVAVTQIEWLLAMHPMILVVGNARGTLRFYDLRCQRRPVLEVCEATQERRPVTALCARPSPAVLKQQAEMRLALASAAESAAAAAHSSFTAQQDATGAGGSTRKAVPPGKHGEGSHCDGSNEGEKAKALTDATELLSACSGRETATVYYADSYGMVYGLRVVGGAALLRLADATCPKYNPTSYRSLGAPAEANWSSADRRRLIAQMLEKQRQRLTSKKNDHPAAAASCVALQIAAEPLGRYKGVMGAVVGLALEPSGEGLVAVGLGRHAFLFDARSRKLRGQASLKQKLTCLLAGAEGAVGRAKKKCEQAQQQRPATSGKPAEPTGSRELKRREPSSREEERDRLAEVGMEVPGSIPEGDSHIWKKAFSSSSPRTRKKDKLRGIFPGAMKQRNPADYPSVDEVLQELEGNTTASATALEQDIYGQYAWEREVERSWECLVEAEGQLRLVGADEESPEERQGPPRDLHIKRALLRSLVILIDATDGMRETDFKPDRLTCATQLLEAHAAAEVLSPTPAGVTTEPAGALRTPGAADNASLESKSSSFFSSNVDELVTALVARRRRRNLPTAHAPSLKNGLDRARALLEAVPPYCTREVIVLYGSIRTCDVGSIDDSIEELRKLRARCSVVSVAPEVRIVRALATQTEGTFGVAMHRDHLCSLLMQHTQPPAWLEGLQPCLIRVGFPSFKESSTAALCSCHSLPRFRTYTCPLCSAKLCDLPLLLAASAIPSRPEGSTPRLAVLLLPTPHCQRECDSFSHEQLRHCPFCVMNDITNIEEPADPAHTPNKGGSN